MYLKALHTSRIHAVKCCGPLPLRTEVAQDVYNYKEPSFIALTLCMPCCVTRSTNTWAASHLVHCRKHEEWEIQPSLGEHELDDGADELFQQPLHQHGGLVSHDAFGGPSEEDVLFARNIPGMDVAFDPMLICTQVKCLCQQSIGSHQILKVTVISPVIEQACMPLLFDSLSLMHAVCLLLFAIACTRQGHYLSQAVGIVPMSSSYE